MVVAVTVLVVVFVMAVFISLVWPAAGSTLHRALCRPRPRYTFSEFSIDAICEGNTSGENRLKFYYR